MTLSITYENSKPENLGNVEINHEEMCFTLYLPIKLRGQSARFALAAGQYVPDNIRESVHDILNKIFHHEMSLNNDLIDKYVYITFKHTYVSPNSMSQRMGWHIDGFGTDDVSYIWYSAAPTEIAEQSFELSSDDRQSMIDMQEQIDGENIVTYPCGSLLRLNNNVVHRVSENHDYEGMRTFIKISISDHVFNLKGNAKNHLIDYDWNMYSREQLRNMEHNRDHYV